MNYLVNQTKELSKRRKLRKNLTYAEQKLWKRLRNRQVGYKFKRQVSVGKFVVDFYCAEYKLAIEIDGDSHYEDNAILYDKDRSDWINKLRIKIIRFTNKDINENIEGVIKEILNQISFSTSPRPSLSRRGAI